ncbi:hypothetical protein PISMIDRAFT_683649, partial [Pisolithus microcarpus 441]
RVASPVGHIHPHRCLASWVASCSRVTGTDWSPVKSHTLGKTLVPSVWQWHSPD